MNRISTTRHWVALAVLAAAQFMVFLDESIVNVALPAIKDDLGYSQAGLAWVVNAYILAFGGLVLLGGRLADLLGRRRVFLAGIALFGASSLIDGLAPSTGVLDAARAAQGVGAAMATPAALALVTQLFPDREERTKALGIWGALSGLGFAIGILLGGLLTEAASWRLVFLINIPVAAATIAVVPRLVPDSGVTRGGAFDARGALAVTAGLFTLVVRAAECQRLRLGLAGDPCRARAGGGLARGLRRDRAAQHRPARAAGVPAPPHESRSQRAAVPARCVVAGGVLSIDAVPPAGARLLAGAGRPRVLPLAAGVASATGVANTLVGRAGPPPDSAPQPPDWRFSAKPTCRVPTRPRCCPASC
jgi:MFS family permease